MYAPVTGYYSVIYGRSGIEKAMNTELNGTAGSLFYTRIQDLITGRQPKGASVELTLDPKVQQAAWDALGDQTGAVVAIDPSTGAILALVSKPSYDPNLLASHDTAAVREAWDTLNADASEPMLDRALRPDLPAGLDVQAGHLRRGPRVRPDAGHPCRRTRRAAAAAVHRGAGELRRRDVQLHRRDDACPTRCGSPATPPSASSASTWAPTRCGRRPTRSATTRT